MCHARLSLILSPPPPIPNLRYGLLLKCFLQRSGSLRTVLSRQLFINDRLADISHQLRHVPGAEKFPPNAAAKVI